jgi:hypothetical protein
MNDATDTPQRNYLVWIGLICLSVGGVMLPQVFLGLLGILLIPAGLALCVVGLCRARRSGQPHSPGFGGAFLFACGVLGLVQIGSFGTELLVEVQDARVSREEQRIAERFSKTIGSPVEPSFPLKQPPSKKAWITWSLVNLAAAAAIAFGLRFFTAASPATACRQALLMAAISPVALFACSAVFGVATRT